MANQKNRLNYIEPNSLPGEFYAGDKTKADNITWQPEDLSIMVDLQVIIPSREYKKSNTSKFDTEYMSILSGVKLGPNKDNAKKDDVGFLTDDYTTISYQEIKNNNASTSEYLGINSIHIEFDTHLYPIVTINFTDVRGSSLMMPQEQYYYDSNSGLLTNNDKACKNFFSSLFKFPYPQFMLSVKGVYGSCVTFMLSVEDFRATFNSDTGNFDVVVKFIGLMYGLYTDIPMNFLLIAPYLNPGPSGLNEYWEKMRDNGTFTFNDDIGGGGQPIMTLFEFRHKYQNFLDLTDIPVGENMIKVAADNSKIRSINLLKEKINNIYEKVEKPNSTEYYKFNDGQVVIFDGNGKSSYFTWNETFVKEYQEAIKLCKEQEVVVNLEDGLLKSLNDNGNTYNSLTIDALRSKLNDEEKAELNDIFKKDKYKYLSAGHTAILYNPEKLLSDLNNNLSIIQSEINLKEEEANKEQYNIFRDVFQFKPTIENVMRMIFAHMDTFMYEYYHLLSGIDGSRTLKSSGFDSKKYFTDIQTISEGDAHMPPFTGFYNDKKERVYPRDIPNMINLKECDFVENIFRSINENIVNDTVYPENSAIEWNFTPICLTDFAYSGQNPYNQLDAEVLKEPLELIRFFYSRLFAACFSGNITGLKKEDTEQITNVEFNNLKNSFIWKKITSSEQEMDKFLSLKFDKRIKWTDEYHFFKMDTNKRAEKENSREEINKKGIVCLDDFTDFDIDAFSSFCESMLKNDRISRVIDSVKWKAKVANSLVIPVAKRSFEDEYLDSNNIFWLPVFDIKNEISIFCWTNKGNVYFYPSAVDSQYYICMNKYGTDCVSFENLDKLVRYFKENKDLKDQKLWCPGVWRVVTEEGISLTTIYDDTSRTDPYESAAEFLDNLRKLKNTEFPRCLNEVDTAIRLSKIDVLAIGAYYYCKKEHPNTSIVIYETELNCFNEGTVIDGIVDYFKKWVDSEYISKGGIKENMDNEKMWDKYFISNTKDKTHVEVGRVRAISPDSELNDMLVKLILEDVLLICYNNNIPNTTIKIKDCKPFINKIKDELKEAKKTEQPTVVNSINNNLSTDVTSNEKESLYYTLKYIYDKWLASFNENNFKLKSPREERAAKASKFNENGNVRITGDESEFDNFLYVDAFYNDISNKFYINPEILFKIIDEQAKGVTDYNVLEFIGRICEKNKLLFRCLPVYNCLYSADTLKEVFKPHSLYNGAKHIRRKRGNTYLIMYTYEPSTKLNIEQDKTNGVGYSNDSFDLGDTFGDITPEAADMFKNDGGYPVSAFAVTPGMQNQSYFTKVSVGMDQPRVTEYTIKNKFALADMAKQGGTMNGMGAGQDLYSIYSNHSYDCRVEMLGCADIMPMMYFQLNNVPMFKGAYMITKVEHNIQNNAMTTTFVGTRVSKYYVPFNTQIFNFKSLTDILNQVNSEDLKDKTLNIVKGTDNISVKSLEKNYTGITLTNGENVNIGNPSNSTAYTTFNVWAALNQMYQVFYKGFRPYTNTESKSVCATAVQTFLFAGFNGLMPSNNTSQGMIVNSKRSGRGFNNCNGYDMRFCLERYNFVCIAAGWDEIKNRTYQAGDVCVMKHPNYGHVCMYNRKKWVSDFVQRRIWVYGEGTEPKERYDMLLYRFKGEFKNDKQYFGSWQSDGSFKEGADPESGDVKELQDGK